MQLTGWSQRSIYPTLLPSCVCFWKSTTKSGGKLSDWVNGTYVMKVQVATNNQKIKISLCFIFFFGSPFFLVFFIRWLNVFSIVIVIAVVVGVVLRHNKMTIMTMMMMMLMFHSIDEILLTTNELAKRSYPIIIVLQSKVHRIKRR